MLNHGDATKSPQLKTYAAVDSDFADCTGRDPIEIGHVVKVSPGLLLRVDSGPAGMENSSAMRLAYWGRGA
jgi:hypothetical protein